MFAKKVEGGERNRGHIQKGSSYNLRNAKIKKLQVPCTHDGAIEKMLVLGTTATNTELKAEQGFDERFIQCALYGSSVDARIVPEQGFDELQTTSTELKAEQGFDELRRTLSKAHHQRMLYTPHC